MEEEDILSDFEKERNKNLILLLVAQLDQLMISHKNLKFKSK